MLDNIVWIDTETTGKDFEIDSIHQFTAIFRNKSLNLFIIPTTPQKLISTPYKIRTDVERISINDAMKIFNSFMKECYNELDNDLSIIKNMRKMENKFKFGGQNPTFDLTFLRKNKLFNEIFDNFFLFKPVDVFSVAFAAQVSGIISEKNWLGNGSIFYELFPEATQIDLHDSLIDTQATMASWNKLIQILDYRP